jgi:hypothetical protein
MLSVKLRTSIAGRKMKRNIAIWMILVLFTLSVTISASSVSGSPLVTQLIYLPIVDGAIKKSIFGGEISTVPYKFNGSWSKGVAGGIYWTRRNGLLWSDIQPNTNTEWNWQKASNLEAQLATTGQAGAQTILTIRSTPLWAGKISGNLCGPVKSTNLGDFANFLSTTVKRYSVAPYNVKYYEIGNEPDVDPSYVSGDSAFGCWGDKDDAYYGGGYYADMLKVIYPAIKMANPQAQVVIGGLLLDCDPTDPGLGTGCAGTGHNPLPAKFFEGILHNGGGPYFDIVNFHGYPTPQTSDINPILAERNFPSWALRGGVVAGKIAFLREVMAAYGVEKPIFQSEVALMRSGSYINYLAFERRKADYVVWVFARNISQNLLGTTWYTLDGPGWYSSGLLDINQEILPAYTAMKFAAQKLSSAAYSAAINAYPGIEGFEFKRGPTYRIWVMFSSDANSPILTLPAGYVGVYDTLGNAITPAAGQITIDHPVYVEFAQ